VVVHAIPDDTDAGLDDRPGWLIFARGRCIRYTPHIADRCAWRELTCLETLDVENEKIKIKTRRDEPRRSNFGRSTGRATLYVMIRGPFCCQVDVTKSNLADE
jgi:hypothetical protein